MSARTGAARRVRTMAATAVVAAVAGAAFAPAVAVAADGPGGHALRMSLGAPTPGAPLKRGGASESMILTVANSSDTAQDFSAWLPGEPDGPSPVMKDSVVFDVTPIDAPATKSAIGHQDGSFQGQFYPASGNASSVFSVPAKTEFTWKVTIGLSTTYPTNDGDFTLHAGRLVGDVDDATSRNTVVFKTDPQIKPGKLNQAWVHDDGEAVARPGRRARLLLEARADGPGEFPAELHRTISASGFRDGAGHPDFILEAKIDGKIVKLKQSGESEWELPVIPKGFGAASGLSAIDLYLSLGEHSDIRKDTVVPLESSMYMTGSGYFNVAGTKVAAGPAVATGSPSATPSTPASQAPSPSAPVTPSASASGSTAATGGTTGGADTAGATSLAATGSGGGLYGAWAAALLAVGGAAAWVGARRRRAARV
ncbi:hypothetical protein [Streptomyces sp. LUP30]|uniref:hypothetical protein n=1 Tax=Streptomyces sp. LUP30 TaxID=1890285 RepID=UPI000851ECC2|nr:hypothetical protein [Streptomyces sp. LUP30]